MTEPQRVAIASPTWWRRNRLALAALLPMLALAVGASSFRYATIYRPTTFSQGQISSTASQHFVASESFGEVTIRRDVTISLISIATDRAGSVTAAPGTTVHVVELAFAAAPEVPLTQCVIELLDADGRVYGTAGGKVMTGTARDATAHPECTPPGAPGPQLDLDGTVLPPAGNPRPTSWPVTATFAMPAGVTPVAVRVHWGPPHFAQLPL